ncbi:diacylglycerol kinase family protein [Neptunicella marina]|uniref:Dual specificity protein phosphatase family protein n=1 Tax=Neptunicella marina TaxID=2125989 RepID=A0A8J6INY9_9ALTE|nr:diacylglycerol kinase family protein [Neptunicella marina]MBC3765340.1 dual specificity protein phosphatase family protein [Neptunicella marina]
MFIIKYYLVASVTFLLAALWMPFIPLQIISGWIGLSLLTVSVAYIFRAAHIFRKKIDGRIPLYIRWLLFPYLIGAQIYNHRERSHDKVPAVQQIEPGLFLACRLFPDDVHDLKDVGVKAILDVTAEFDGLDWTAESEQLAYLNVPVLDHQSPGKKQLLKAVNWIENQRRDNRGVVVHCALGRGRSVLVMAAYLLCKYPELSVEEVLQKIRDIRETANLNKYQLKVLRKMHKAVLPDLRQFAWLIVNPVSGGGKWGEYREEILQRLSPHFQLKIVETTEQKGADELAKEALEQNASMLIAGGGDGTLTAVAKNLINSDIPMGIIPLGTANALAHVLLGSSSKILPAETACETIIQGHKRKIDTASCNGDLMLLVMGVGFEQKMIKMADREAKNQSGQMAYLSALWQAVNTNEHSILMISFDDKPRQEMDCASFVVANAAPFTTVLAQGGGEPDVEDGLFDITWLPARENASDQIISMTELAFSGLTSQYRSDSIQYTRAAKVTIERKDGEPLEYVIDGEPEQADKLQLEINPQSLAVFSKEDIQQS